ncbi:MAG: hypothetical protein ACKVU0_09145 [Saprospiraceae bacterium]
MKQLIKFATLSTLLFACSFIAYSQDDPCLRVNGDYLSSCPVAIDQAILYNCPSNRVQFQVFNAESTLENLSFGARYKAFWIFGDGNFRFHEFGDLEQDLATYEETYVYPEAGPYSPVVVLSERKSNTSPPRGLMRNINVENRDVNPDIPDSFSFRILGAHSMDIFNHDRNRPHYPTVFAISSLASDKLTDSIFFFYNCEKLEAGYNRLKIHEALDFVSFPHYFPTGLTPAEKATAISIPRSLSLLARELSTRFENYLEVGVGFNANPDRFSQQKSVSERTSAALRDMGASPFSELRFFPALISTWNRDWIRTVAGMPDTVLPIGHYLALSVGNQPLSRLTNPDDPTSINPVYSEVLQYFPTLNAANLQVGPERFIRGIATREVEMVAGIDPNGLEVLQVCPLGQNRYQVKIRMEVCNEGFMHEQNFGFRIIDHTGVISEPNFIAGTAPNLVSSPDPGWHYKWNVFLDGLPLPDATESDVAETRKTCDTLIFTVTTNWLGVQRLASGRGLELCVQFSHANEECNYNYKLDERRLSPFTGYECGEMPPPSWLCCLPVYITLILAIIILALLIWIAWYLKRKLK